MTAYFQGDPRQKIQICDRCNEPTGNCEEDDLWDDGAGPFCSYCWEAIQEMKNVERPLYDNL